MNEIHHLPLVGDYTGWQGTLLGAAFIIIVIGGQIEKYLGQIVTLLRRQEYREKNGRWPD